MCSPEVSVCLTPWPCRLLPKSARWLMANNQKEEAWKLIQKAARMNGVCQSKDLEMLRVSVHVYLGCFLFWMSAACWVPQHADTVVSPCRFSRAVNLKCVHQLCVLPDLQLWREAWGGQETLLHWPHPHPQDEETVAHRLLSVVIRE